MGVGGNVEWNLQMASKSNANGVGVCVLGYGEEELAVRRPEP
jgi:hypothetical protein